MRNGGSMRLVSLGLVGWLLNLLPGAAWAQLGGTGIPSYPGSATFSLGDMNRVNGEELRMYYFTTQASPEVVAEHYQRMWEAAGQVVSLRRTGRSGVSVGYVDLRDGKTRTVSLWRERDLTFGFSAVLAGFATALRADPGVAGDLPVHPRAEGLITYDSLDQAATFRTVSYSVAAPLAENERFYMRELGARGFVLTGTQRSKTSGQSVMLDFARGERKITVTLAWASFYGRCAVFVVTNAMRDAQQEDKP